MGLRKSIAVTIVAMAATQALGQSSGGTFRIDSVTVTSGGTLAGGAFNLHGTFGQPFVGAAGGGEYAFNAGAVGTADGIFRNGFESQ